MARRKRSLTATARWLVSIEHLRGARKMDELLSSLAKLCEAHGFVAARLEFQPEVQADNPASPLKAAHQGYLSHAIAPGADEMNWMWPGEETFSRQNSLVNCCWSLRLPLVSSKGRNMGAFTFYQTLTGSEVSEPMPLDLAETTDLLSRELSAALDFLSQRPAPVDPPLAAGEYVPNFKRDRVPLVAGGN